MYSKMRITSRWQERRQRRLAAPRNSFRYESVADAAEVTGDPRYAGRGTKVWYVKPGPSRDLSMGYDFLVKYDIPVPTLRTLKDTHTLLGEVGERDPEKVWMMMQGEIWSPGGEAWDIAKRAGHTSMMVGDIVQVGRKLYMADPLGFKELPA